jgi:hypothetical protein
MTNRALANRIARKIFATGEWNGETADRMAYKFKGSPEREGGGLCESAMADIIKHVLESSPTTGDKPS